MQFIKVYGALIAVGVVCAARFTEVITVTGQDPVGKAFNIAVKSLRMDTYSEGEGKSFTLYMVLSTHVVR